MRERKEEGGTLPNMVWFTRLACGQTCALYYRDALAPHMSNAQGGPPSKRGGCVRTLHNPLPTGLNKTLLKSNEKLKQKESEYNK